MSITRQCINACVLAYTPTPSPNYTDVGAFRYGIIDLGDCVLVAFRGTANVQNVKTDIRVFPPAKTPQGYFGPRGFVKAFRELAEADVVAKAEAVAKGRNIVFTGHSMGGTIAVYFAELTQRPVITIGCPKTYLRWFGFPNTTHLRIINDDDPVPMMPGILYVHGTEPMIQKDNDSEWIDIKDHSAEVYRKLYNKIHGGKD